MGIIDKIDLDEIGVREKFEEEIERFSKFQKILHDTSGKIQKPKSGIDARAYAKYLLKEGSIPERRELLSNLRSRLTYRDRIVTLA